MDPTESWHNVQLMSCRIRVSCLVFYSEECQQKYLEQIEDVQIASQFFHKIKTLYENYFRNCAMNY